MRGTKFQLQLTILGILSSMLSGCQPQTTHTLTPIPTSSTTPTLTQTISPSVTPVKTITHTVTPTATSTTTPEPVTIEFVTTNLQQSGGWDLAEPYSDPLAPEIIIATEDGYQLDPDFKVARIELSYEWWGLGDPVFDYQWIERRNSRFWRGGASVAANNVQALIQSISHLYPQPQMLETITHTDDYPIWAIELINDDGVHVLLYSKSNGFHYVPWNVIYNGQIYSQFDGQIGVAMSNLFKVAKGQPSAWTSEGDYEEGYLIVDTTGWPGQLSDGFSGLLAVQSSFSYWPDPQKGEIHGYFRGRSSINGMGNMIIGSITELTKIELDVAEKQTLSCSIEIVPSDDPAASIWEFICPVNATPTERPFRYPIRITFRTDQKQSYTSSGELFGYWKQRTVLPKIRYPEEIGKILSDSPVVKDLLRDHQIAVIEFNGAVDPITGSMDHHWTADIVLIGQAKFDDRILPYSVTIEAEIIDSKLVRWDLDRQKLNNFLIEVLNQAITRRFLARDPNLILNLYYGESGKHPIVLEWDLPACANLPTANGLPNPEQSLRGFGFNQSIYSMDFFGIQILLMDDGLRVYNLDIKLNSTDNVWASLLPVEIQSQNAPPFVEVKVTPYGPHVYILWDPNASESAIEKYKELVQTWSVNTEIKRWGVVLDRGTLGITSDGSLSLISCEEP